jgi:hypothetical protein
MNTSAKAIELLQIALTNTQSATAVIGDLLVEHEYQDVASLVTQASAALLESAILLMQFKDDFAVEKMEQAENLLDSVYGIIDGETDDDEN